MKKILLALCVIVVAGAVWWQTRPSAFDTDAPMLSSGAPIDLLEGLDPLALSAGWVHRQFLTISAADYRMTEDAGTPALQCKTDNSASILARDTQIALSDLPILSWRWKVVQPIESDVDEDTRDGDDHPVRFFAVFSNVDGERRAMEIIWSNQKYAPGDYKIIDGFYHYVANGLAENVGQWHAHRVDLRQIYSDIGGTGTPILETLGFFCDSDNTGTKSEGLFADVRLTPDGS